MDSQSGEDIMTIINMSGGKAGKPPTYQARTVTPQAFPLSVQPQEGYDALSSVQVNAPANLLAQNIRKDVNIAGVVGTYEATAPTMRLQQKSVTPGKSSQTVTPDAGYDGLSQVTVNGDSDLTPGNIKSGVNIFGVEGTYSGASPITSSRISFGFSPVKPTSPMIISTRRYDATTGATTYLSNRRIPPWTIICNHYEEAENNAGSAALFGAFPIQTALLCSSDTPYKRIDSSSFNFSFSSNRDTETMDSFLKSFSRTIGLDYFSGTMKCFPWMIWWGTDSWGSCVTDSSLIFTKQMDVSYTYSNGNCTYTIPSGSKYWDTSFLVRADFDAETVSPVLYFGELTYNPE